MFRASLCLLLGLSLVGVSNSALASNARNAPSTGEIKQAIEKLGNKNFETRKSAQRFLFEAGEAAERFLNEAARSEDAEVANAAKAILEKFEWGLYPDTPKEIREWIELFREGKLTSRDDVLRNMFDIRPIPFKTIDKLLAKVDGATDREIHGRELYPHALTSIPKLLEAGDADAVEQMLEFFARRWPEFAANNYAGFMYLRAKTDSAITQFEKTRNTKGDNARRAAATLVFLYRVNGDFAKAREAAFEFGDARLIDRTLWEVGDWNGLLTRSRDKPVLELLYARLARDQKAFDERMAQIKKLAADSNDGDFWAHANALLIDSKPNEAIAILTDKKLYKKLTFELFCAQMKYRDALQFAGDSDSDEIQTVRARLLFLLGKKDEAVILFRKFHFDRSGDPSAAVQRIATEMQLGLLDLALEHAATMLAPFKDFDGPVDQLILKAIFNDDFVHAAAWLSLLGDEEPIAAMRRVWSIFAGKIERDKLAELADKMLKKYDPQSADVAHFNSVDAVAAAWRANGDRDKADHYLKLASEKAPTLQRCLAYGDYLVRQKKYDEAAAIYGKGIHLPSLGKSRYDYRSKLRAEGASHALAAYLRGRALNLGGDVKGGRRSFDLGRWLPLGNATLRADLVRQLYLHDLPDLAESELTTLLAIGWDRGWDSALSKMVVFRAGLARQKKEYAVAADLNERCMAAVLRSSRSYENGADYIRIPEFVHNCRVLGGLTAGNADRVLAQANASLDRLPGSLELTNSVVPDFEKLGMKTQADVIYRRARGEWQRVYDEYPTSAFAHNGLAWLMVNCGREMESALGHARKANELEPRCAAYLDTLAEIHFRKGDREAALRMNGKCIELEPGRIYYRQQRSRFRDQAFNCPNPYSTD